MQRLYPWLAAIFFIGCVVLGYEALRERGLLALTTVQRETDAREEKRRLADLQNRLVALQQAQIQAAKQASSAAPGPTAASAGGGTPNFVKIHVSDIIKDHPEYAALYAKDMRRNVIRQYGEALNTIGLTPEQIAKMKDLLVERTMTSMDAEQAAEAAGLDRGSQAWKDAMRQASQGVEQEIAATLGSDSASLMNRLQTSMSAHNGVQYNTAPDMTDAGVPLTPVQAEAVAQAAMDASWTNPNGGTQHPPNYNTPDPTTGRTPKEDRIATQASQVLSPAQLQVLMQDQLEADQRTAIMKQYMPANSGVGYQIVP
jgi:hypothetical protein